MTTRRRWFAVLVLPAWVMVGCSSNSEEETVPTGSEPDASVDSTTQPDTATENSVDSPVQDSSTTDSGEDASPDVQQEAATDAGADAASDGPPLEKYCDNPEPGFDPANPGIHFWFDVGTVVLLGQSAALGAGGFQPTVREDYCNEPKGFDIPLDSCTDQPAPAVLPQCSNKSDCAPEQDCVQRTDSQGTPIEGSEYCATPYSMLNVGPFTVTGFATGPREFNYNASQSGAYTSPNGQKNDGSLPIEAMAFDADYQIAGDGSPDAGLGAYSGSFHFPADFQLTAPPTVPVGRMGLAGLEIDPTQDLTLEWVGGDPNAVLEITMSGPPNAGATVTCKARNDGSFTIPAAMVQAVGFGTAPIFNMLDMRLGSTGKASGTGITISRVSITQALTRNIKTL